MRGSCQLCHLRQQLLPKRVAPQTPASPHSFPLLRLVIPAPQLHPPLKFLSPRRTVFRNSHLPQQSPHSQPSCALARSLEILPITAPPIGAQLLFLAQPLRPHRIQMHIIADRSQISIAAAIDYQRLVTSPEQMAVQFVLAVEAPVNGSVLSIDTNLVLQMVKPVRYVGPCPHL